MDIQLNQQKEVKEKIKSVSNDIANQMSRVGDTNVSFDKRKVEIEFMLLNLCEMYRIAYLNKD